MEGHVVGGAILVRVGDVMDGTYGQDDLAQRVNDGQVNNGPAQRESGVKQAYSGADKMDKGQDARDDNKRLSHRDLMCKTYLSDVFLMMCDENTKIRRPT